MNQTRTFFVKFGFGCSATTTSSELQCSIWIIFRLLGPCCLGDTCLGCFLWTSRIGATLAVGQGSVNMSGIFRPKDVAMARTSAPSLLFKVNITAMEVAWTDLPSNFHRSYRLQWPATLSIYMIIVCGRHMLCAEWQIYVNQLTHSLLQWASLHS